jgi:hypothetical protein
MKTRTSKSRKMYGWGCADGENAGTITLGRLFGTRAEARERKDWLNNDRHFQGRFYVVKVVLSWEIRQHDRW